MVYRWPLPRGKALGRFRPVPRVGFLVLAAPRVEEPRVLRAGAESRDVVLDDTVAEGLSINEVSVVLESAIS